MFYNGFNLLLDIVLVVVAVKATVWAMKFNGWTKPPF